MDRPVLPNNDRILHDLADANVIFRLLKKVDSFGLEMRVERALRRFPKDSHSHVLYEDKLGNKRFVF